MRLTSFADYALRSLIFLAVRPGARVTTEELANAYGISQAHLRKVVARLGEINLVALYRGRDGGLELKEEPAAISVGKVLRAFDSAMPLVECFDAENDQCVISPVCGLKSHLARAEAAFYGELDQVMLSDVLKPARLKKLRALLNSESA